MSALYVYMSAFFIKFFGMETFVFRIPAVIFSAITIIFSSLIVKRAYGKNWALVNAFVFCLLPYFTMQSRFGLDCNIMLGAACFCIYMTMLAIEKNKTWFYLLTGCFWGIAFYTYVLSYIVFSVFLLMIIVHQMIKKNFKILYIIPPMAVIAFPLVVMVWITVFDMETVHIGCFTIYKIAKSRAGEFSLHNIPMNFIHMIQMIFTYDEYPCTAFPEFYTLYKISIPICIIGLIYVICKGIRKKNTESTVGLFMLFFLLAEILPGCFREKTCIYNMNAVYVSLLYLLISGLVCIYRGCASIGKNKIKHLGKFVTGGILVCYLVNFYHFTQFYFNVYPNSVYSFYLFTDRLDSVVGSFDKYIQPDSQYPIYIDAYYLYYLIEKRTDPYTVPIDYNGMDRYGSIHFISEFSAMPEQIDQNSIYVVFWWHQDYLDLLRGYDFTEEQRGNFVCFFPENM